MADQVTPSESADLAGHLNLELAVLVPSGSSRLRMLEPFVRSPPIALSDRQIGRGEDGTLSPAGTLGLST